MDATSLVRAAEAVKRIIRVIKSFKKPIKSGILNENRGSGIF